MPPSEQLTDASGQIIPPRRRHRDPADRTDEVHKLILNANDPVCKRLVVLLPIPNSEGNASDMLQPLQRLALWAAMGTLSLTVVGGFTDACAPLFATDRVNGIRRLFESTTKRYYKHLAWRTIDSAIEDSSTHPEDYDAAVMEEVERYTQRVVFYSVDDVLTSGELDDVVSREEILDAVAPHSFTVFR
jgi:hypothetical protein